MILFIFICNVQNLSNKTFIISIKAFLFVAVRIVYYAMML